MSKVSIIGLGAIGGGVGQALARVGTFELSGYDPRPEAFAPLGGAMRTGVSPADASEGVDVAFVAVVNDAQVRAVMTGEGGVLSAKTLPGMIVILSTISIPVVFWAAEEAAKRGVKLIDCGVCGTRGLQENAMPTMVGGDVEAIAQARPVIEAFSSPMVHCGELGNGMRAKLACNMILFTDWAVAWQGAQLATAAGVPLDRFVEAVNAAGKWVRPHMGLVEDGVGVSMPGMPTLSRPSTAAFADKDLRAALALAADLGVELPSAEVALRIFPRVAGLA